MKVQQSICSNAGFTLVESMLTLAIMSMGLLALAGLQITALRGNALARKMTTAVSIAEQRIEERQRSRQLAGSSDDAYITDSDHHWPIAWGSACGSLNRALR